MSRFKTMRNRISIVFIFAAVLAFPVGAYGATTEVDSVDIRSGGGRRVESGETLIVSPDGVFVRTGADASAAGVTVNPGGSLILSGDILVERAGTRTFAVGVLGAGGDVSIDAGDITASGTRSRGVRLNASNADISADRIIASGDLSHGVSTYQNQDTNAPGSDIKIDAGEIIASGTTAYGVRLGPGNSADITAGSVTASGSGSYGVGVSEGSVNVTDSVLASGPDSYGVSVSTGSINVSGDVLASGSGSYGTYIVHSGNISIGNNVIVTGDGAYGARVHEHGRIEVDGGVIVSANQALGVSTRVGGVLSVSGDVAVSGEGSRGVSLTGTMPGVVSSVSVGSRNVSVSGDQSYGIYVSAWSADVNVAGDINASDGSTGIRLNSTEGGTVSADIKGTVMAEGAGTLGVYVTDDDRSGSRSYVSVEKVIVSGDSTGAVTALGVNTEGTVTVGTDTSSQNMLITGSNNQGAFVDRGGQLDTIGTTTLDGNDLIGIEVTSSGNANLDIIEIAGGQDNIGVTLDSTVNTTASINQVLINGTAAGDQGNNLGVYQTNGTSTIGYLLAGTEDSTGLALSGGKSTLGSIDVTGANAVGVSATGASALTANDLLTVSGAGAVGVDATTSGAVNLAGASISGGIGLLAASTKVTISEDWTVSGTGQGIIVSTDAEVSMDKNLNVTGGTGAIVENAGELNVAGTVSASGTGSTGVQVQAGGEAFLNNVSADLGGTGVVTSGLTTVSGTVTAGDRSYGIVASGPDGVAYVGSVDVTGPNAFGVYASQDGKIYVSDDITLGDAAAGSYGAVADTGGKVYISADIHSTAVVGSWDVYTSGAYASKDGAIFIDGSVDMKGDFSRGVTADGGYLAVTGNIKMDGNYGFGALADNGGEIVAAGNIVTSGEAMHGAVADAYSSIDMTGNVTTYGMSSHGVSVAGNSMLNMTGNITTLGNAAYGARALDHSTIDITGSIATSGDRAHGAYAFDGSSIDITGAILTYGATAYGAYANNAYISHDGTITTLSDDAYGAFAENGGTFVQSGDIETSGKEAYGAYASGDATIDMTGHITTWGEAAAGALAYNGSSIDVTGDILTYGKEAYGTVADNAYASHDGTITTLSDDAYGVYALNGGILLQTGDIATSGDRAHGAFAVDGGILDMTGLITTWGEAAHGVLALDGASADATGNILTYGVNAYGVAADNAYASHDGTIIATGTGAGGAYSVSGGTLIQSGDVTTRGREADGATASADSTLVMTGNILTLGERSIGAHAYDNSSLDLTGDILTYGDNAHAALATGGSTITIDGIGGFRLIETSGDNSHGLYAEDDGVINMTNGLIAAASNDSSWLMYANTGGTINLDQVLAPAPDSLNLLQTDSSGTVNANNSFLFGDITHTGLNAGSLDVNLTGGSKFIGAANASEDNAGAWINITLDAISDDFAATDYWRVTKDSNMQGNLTNRGMIDFTHATSADFNGLNAYVVDDSAYKKVTVSNFTGTVNSGDLLGQLIMKADINANKGDYIYGFGNAAGNNDVDLQLMTYAGAERMDQALVYMENGAGGDASFALLDNAVTENGIADAGAWNYILEEGMDGAAKEWYLKRNGLTVLGQGLVMGAVTPELWYTEVATLYDRMSDYKNPQYKGGIWASASYRKVEFDGEGGAFGMLPFDVKMKTLTVGYDQKNNHSNGTWYHGFMLGYGQEERDNWAADADTDSMHLSIYTVYKKESGFYLSALAKYNHYDTDLTVNKVDKLTQQFGYDQVTGGLKQRGLGISMMTGKRFNMGEEGWYWEPQMQLSYMRIFGDKFITNSGLDVDVEATTSLRARAGFLFGKAFQLQNGSQLDLFADLSYNKEFDGETDIWLSGGKYTRDLGDAWGSYGLGFSWKMGERSYLGGRIAYGSGSDRTEPISATLGLLFETN